MEDNRGAPDSLMSFTDSTNLISTTVPELTTKTQKRFNILRIFIFIIISITDMLVFFQRACPTVVTKEIADAYGVDVADLGIFSSTFYYPYALFQPFAGLLADVMEPAYIIGGATMLSALGAFICGSSKSLVVGCIGRFIVGVGSAPVYCPCNRIILNWFPLKNYAKILGVFVFAAGCGSLLAQTPLTLLAAAIGWRWCFYVVAIVCVIFSLIILFFVRGNPVVLGYPPVNDCLAKDVGEYTIKEKFTHLWTNFKCVISNSSFWCLALYAFFSNGAYYNVAGIWGGPYLKDMIGYDSVKTSNALLALSLGANFGSLLLPLAADVLKSKKWFVFFGTLLAAFSCIPFIVCPEKLNFITISALFALLSAGTTAFATVAYPMCTEYFHPSAGATVTGCINCFAFLSLIGFMPMTGKVLEHFGLIPGTDRHHPDGYKYGLWVFNACSMFISVIFTFFAKDPKGVQYTEVDNVLDYKEIPD